MADIEEMVPLVCMWRICDARGVRQHSVRADMRTDVIALDCKIMQKQFQGATWEGNAKTALLVR